MQQGAEKHVLAWQDEDEIPKADFSIAFGYVEIKCPNSPRHPSITTLSDAQSK